MQALAAKEIWAEYVRDPQWLPHRYDARSDSLTFAFLPRATQRSMTFIDPRFMDPRAESGAIQVSHLSERAIRANAGPLHFVFHTGFCCSTLLARALDIPGVSMGLKEPGVLAFFAEYWANGRRNVGAFEALSATLDLLSRPLSPGETQIVKPSNVVNHIIPQLLHSRRDAKAILLYSSLETFLRAIARRGVDGRVFARHMFHQFAKVNPLGAGYRDEDAILQSDLQVAAQAWLMQISFMDQITKRFGVDRIRVLNADTFLADPAKTLSQISAFFEMGLALERAQQSQAAGFFSRARKRTRPSVRRRGATRPIRAGRRRAPKRTDDCQRVGTRTRDPLQRPALAYRDHVQLKADGLGGELVRAHPRRVIVNV